MGGAGTQRVQRGHSRGAMPASEIPANGAVADASELDLEEGLTVRWPGPSMSSLQLSCNFSTFFTRHNLVPTMAIEPTDGRTSGGARQRIAMNKANDTAASEARRDYEEARAPCMQQ